MNIEKIKEYLLYVFAFLLPWQTVFLLREVFVDGEKWQYGTIGIYVSDLILVLLLIVVVTDELVGIVQNSKLKILNSGLSFGDTFKSKTHKLCHFDRIRQLAEEWRNLSIAKAWDYILGEISRLCFVRTLLNSARDDKVSWFAGLFLVWTGLSVFWAADKFLAAYFSFKMCLGVGLFFAIHRVKFDWKKLLIILFVSALIQSGLGVWQYLSQETFSNKWLGMSEYNAADGGVSVLENESGRWIRAYGAFPHPNILGGYLVLVILVAFGINLKFKVSNLNSIFNDKILKIVSVSIFCLLAMGLLFSFSRSAWLALAFGLVSWFEITRLRFIRTSLNFARDDLVKWSVVMVFFIGLIVGLNHENFFSRFDTEQRLEQKSVSDRVNYFSEAKQVIQDDFWFGVGAGNYTLEVIKNDGLKKPIWEYQPVHNVFLLIFSELGLIGIVIFILFLLFVFLECRIVALPIFVALFISMMLDHWLWTSHFGLLIFWFVLGILSVDNRRVSC